MQTIKIEYFAILREQAGLDEETVSTAATTVADLYGELRERHGFAADAETLKVAVNDEFADWDHVLGEHDVVVFIPPVAGG